MNQQRWYSVEEIGQYLGVSKDTIYAWIANKGLAAALKFLITPFLLRLESLFVMQNKICIRVPRS